MKMVFKRFKNVVGIMLLLVAAILTTACSRQTNSANKGKIIITSTMDFYGEVAKAVAGKQGQVTSIITDPNVDPHDYDPAPSTAQKVAKSRIVIANGLGYDSWMNNLVKNGNDNLQYIKVGEKIMGQKSGDNPHLWYDPQTMPRVANELARRFGKIQPKNKQYFKQNAQKYIASLKPITAKIAQVKKAAKKDGRQQVYVSEPVFDYAIKAMGFTIGDPKFENDTEKGTDPAPSTIKAMQKGIQDKKIAFFVDNKQASSKTVANLITQAKKQGIPVLKVTETMPAHKNYQQWMVDQYDQLLEILQKEKS